MANCSNIMRVRVDLSATEINSLSSFCWLSVDISIVKRVSDFENLIIRRFQLNPQHKLQLYVKHYLLPSDETIFLVRDDDLVRVVPATENLCSEPSSKTEQLCAYIPSQEVDVLLENNGPKHHKHKKKKRKHDKDENEMEGVSLESKFIKKQRKHFKCSTENVQELETNKTPVFNVYRTDTAYIEDNTNDQKISEEGIEITKNKKENEARTKDISSAKELNEDTTQEEMKNITPSKSEDCETKTNEEEKEYEFLEKKMHKRKRKRKSKKSLEIEPSINAHNESSVKILQMSSGNNLEKETKTTRETLPFHPRFMAIRGIKKYENKHIKFDYDDKDDISKENYTGLCPKATSTPFDSLSYTSSMRNTSDKISKNTSTFNSTVEVSSSVSNSLKNCTSDLINGSPEKIGTSKDMSCRETLSSVYKNVISPSITTFAVSDNSDVNKSQKSYSFDCVQKKNPPEAKQRFRELSKKEQLNSVLTNKSIFLKCLSEDQQPPVLTENKLIQKNYDKDIKTPPDLTGKNKNVLAENSRPQIKKKNFSQYPPLRGPPRPGDIIAYKILELSASYCPEISEYKEATVVNYNFTSDTVEVELVGDEVPVVGIGKFDLPVENEDEETTVWKNNKVEVAWTSMIEPRLLSS
ncbi:coilin-like [Limulus polyphemus]|uniref:Coilin-like n=1 Tax=Limulus polyphemus TaxID=6850 RepID=A0ABM1BA15_LIMPO|nr:coilin-like [Limulus polyphemus]